MTTPVFTLEELEVILLTVDRDSLTHRLALKCYVKQIRDSVYGIPATPDPTCFD